MQFRPRRQLTALGCALWLAAWGAGAGAEPALSHETTLVWHRSDSWFGGWSGVEVLGDGSALIAISDKGQVLRADMNRARDRLTGLSNVRSVALRNPAGKLLRDKHTDAEGLARSPDGAVYVSFEHIHRVMRLDPDTGRTSARIPPPQGQRLQPNSGFEALAAGPGGRLLAIPERSGARTRPFPLFAHDGTGWSIAASLPRRGPFLPVGADMDHKGRLWLLERATTPLGFRTRIRRFDLGTAPITETTLLTTGPGRFDNLEAISTWRDHTGTLHVTLISDDNFLPIQRTQIVEFSVSE